MYNRAAFDTALGRRPPDTVVEGGTVLNVFTGELLRADIAISDGVFAVIGDISGLAQGEHVARVDATGTVIVPGLIDSHVHIEPSKLSITGYAKAVLPHGTTAVYTALDHIASVLGIEGVDYIMDEARSLPFRVYNPLPCKVPHAVPPSNLGAKIGLDEQLPALDRPDARGIAEVAFDFLRRDDPEIFGAIEACEARGLLVHGDGPGIHGAEVGAFASAGLRDCHEMLSKEDVLAKLRAGVYTLIRECPSASYLKDCVRAITETTVDTRRVGLCTDDVDPSTLVEQGHMDHVVREAIRHGVPPVTAVQMATLNNAEALRLDHEIGCVAPGRFADFLLVPSLDDFNVAATYVAGKQITEGPTLVVDLQPPPRSERVLRTMNVDHVSPEDLVFHVPAQSGHATVLSLTSDDGIIYRRRDVDLPIVDGAVYPDVDRDVAYLSVVERFRNTGSRATGFVSGFGLTAGALASSNQPDDQNIACLGVDTTSMATAINRVIDLGGGQVVARGRDILAELSLPIAGIMTDLEPAEVRALESELTAAAHSLGARPEKPFVWFMFIMITTLPEYSITDLGLVEYESLSVISPLVTVAAS